MTLLQNGSLRCHHHKIVIGVHRVRPGFKNCNRKLDLPEDNSGSYYRNRNIFFYNPEPEFQFLVQVPAYPQPEIGFHRISGRNLLELIVFRFPARYSGRGRTLAVRIVTK